MTETINARWNGPFVGELFLAEQDKQGRAGKQEVLPGDVYEVGEDQITSGHWEPVETPALAPPPAPPAPAPEVPKTESEKEGTK